MARQQRVPTWPFLCILACLFVLSAASPRAWEKLCRRDSATSRHRPVASRAVLDESARQVHPAMEYEPVAAAPATMPTLRELVLVTETPPVDVPPAPFVEETPRSEFVAVEPSEKIASLPIAPELVEEINLPGVPSFDTPYPTPVAETIEPAPAMEPAAPAVWREPTALLAQLGALGGNRVAAEWAGDVEEQIHRLGRALDTGEESADAALLRLEALLGQVEGRAQRIADPLLAGELRRAGFAVNRRLAVWRRTMAVVDAQRDAVARQADPETLALCLAEVAAATAGPESGPAWREYLMVDALEGLVSGERTSADAATGALIDEVLQRLARTPRTEAQRSLLASEPLVQFRAELVRWKGEAADPAKLLEHIELYEETGMQMLAHDVVADCERLAASSDPADQTLARHLEGHYRNANFRMAVTQAMLDRLAPERAPERMPVRETLLGVPVRGRSVTRSEVGLVLDPDPSRLRVTLEIRGNVLASTTSDAGMATFFNDSKSLYVARKPLEIDLGGIRLLPIEVGADSHTRLRRIETFLDPVPILGSIAQGIAEAQYDESQPRARMVTRWKVASRARQRIEEEAVEQIGQLRDRLSERVFVPLDRLQVEPKLIEASTTAERLTMRVRLAGSRQLGGHTPRPRAPGDSLLSVQIHESGLNNLLEGIGLGGQTLTLAEITRRVAEKANILTPWELDPEHDDVEITFPETDAVTVGFEDGKAVITLSIVRLEKGSRSFKNFQVRAVYVPQVHGRSAELVREDFIQMSGQVSTRAQIVLRGIFAKAFSKSRPVPIVPQRIIDDPRLADLAVTQLVLDDGWLGLALGPSGRPVAGESSVAKR